MWNNFYYFIKISQNFQKFLKDSKIEFFTTNSETKASIVERFNRTLKTRMHKYFKAKTKLIQTKLELAVLYGDNIEEMIK